jgi:hypothetical protein
MHPLLDVLARYPSGRNRQKHRDNFLISGLQFCPIQLQKDFCHGCGKAFVAIQEGMGLGKLLDGPRVQSEHFIGTEEKQSDFLYSSGPCASWV